MQKVHTTTGKLAQLIWHEDLTCEQWRSGEVCRNQSYRKLCLVVTVVSSPLSTSPVQGGLLALLLPNTILSTMPMPLFLAHELEMIRFPVITYEAISKPIGLLKLLSYSSHCSCSIVVSLSIGVSSFSSTLPHWPSPIKRLFSTLYFPVVLRILFSVVCGSFFRGDHSPGWWEIWSPCLSGQMLLFTLPWSLLV